jgi:uracil-DNA glycosylase family 4
MGCAPVLSEANGPGSAKVMFVGEAPGRFGAGRTGVPFSGDVAGERFERLMAEAGLPRADVFVTNAVLCVPVDGGGRNRRPRPAEVRACLSWLEDTVRVVDPALVVAMGTVALRALSMIEAHGLVVSNAGEPPVPWFERELAAVYHPAARSQVHRPWARQVEDWRAIGAFARRLESVHSRA